MQHTCSIQLSLILTPCMRKTYGCTKPSLACSQLLISLCGSEPEPWRKAYKCIIQDTTNSSKWVAGKGNDHSAWAKPVPELLSKLQDGDRFWRMPEAYVRGNTIKYLRVPDEVIDKVKEESHKQQGIPFTCLEQYACFLRLWTWCMCHSLFTVQTQQAPIRHESRCAWYCEMSVVMCISCMHLLLPKEICSVCRATGWNAQQQRKGQG